MKIYTKTGDGGETSLWGGKRVKKNDLRLKAYGTVDELNAVLGIASCEIKEPKLKLVVESIQNNLFNLGADLATPIIDGNKNLKVIRITNSDVVEIEKWIDQFEELVPVLKEFILPGGSKGAANLQFARTVCRRAERLAVELNEIEKIGNFVIIYLNRLSDLLFVLARYDNVTNQIPEPTWKQ